MARGFSRNIFFYEYPATCTHAKEPPAPLWEHAFGKRTVLALRQNGLLNLILKKKVNDAQLKSAKEIVFKYKKYAVDVVIALSNYSTSHTIFRGLLTRICGSRYASMPLFDVRMLEGAMDIDYKELRKRTNLIAKEVQRAYSIEIKTPNGTCLAFSKEGRKVNSDTGVLTRPGSFGNLPSGEVFLAPCEGTAQGKLILEWAPTRRLASPVALIVKDGLVSEVRGAEPYAEELQGKLKETTDNRNIAELGIGTNHRAKRPDNILESEKIMGTIHIALGDNSSFGGKVKTPFHQDFIFFKPTVILIDKDGVKTKLMQGGRFREGVS